MDFTCTLSIYILLLVWSSFLNVLVTIKIFGYFFGRWKWTQPDIVNNKRESFRHFRDISWNFMRLCGCALSFSRYAFLTLVSVFSFSHFSLPLTIFILPSLQILQCNSPSGKQWHQTIHKNVPNSSQIITECFWMS